MYLFLIFYFYGEEDNKQEPYENLQAGQGIDIMSTLI